MMFRSFVFAAALILAASGLPAQPGVDWEEVAQITPFSPRVGHSVVVFANQMWIVGGWDSAALSLPEDPVLRSADGASWTLATAAPAFGSRAGHGSVVFDGKMWVIGGTIFSPFGADWTVWSSPDGVTWTMESTLPDASEEFEYGSYFSAMAHEGELWVVNNPDSGALPADVWRSPDGVNWTHIVGEALDVYHKAPAAPFMGKIWYLGNQTTYSTTDGMNWTTEMELAYGPRDGATALVALGKLWLIAGQEDETVPYNTVYSSPDGQNWTLEVEHAAFSERHSHASVVFNDYMWILGGVDDRPIPDVILNDVWRSALGSPLHVRGSGWLEYE